MLFLRLNQVGQELSRYRLCCGAHILGNHPVRRCD